MNNQMIKEELPFNKNIVKSRISDYAITFSNFNKITGSIKPKISMQEKLNLLRFKQSELKRNIFKTTRNNKIKETREPVEIKKKVLNKGFILNSSFINVSFLSSTLNSTKNEIIMNRKKLSICNNENIFKPDYTSTPTLSLPRTSTPIVSKMKQSITSYNNSNLKKGVVSKKRKALEWLNNHQDLQLCNIFNSTFNDDTVATTATTTATTTNGSIKKYKNKSQTNKPVRLINKTKLKIKSKHNNNFYNNMNVFMQNKADIFYKTTQQFNINHHYHHYHHHHHNKKSDHKKRDYQNEDYFSSGSSHSHRDRKQPKRLKLTTNNNNIQDQYRLFFNYEMYKNKSTNLNKKCKCKECASPRSLFMNCNFNYNINNNNNHHLMNGSLIAVAGTPSALRKNRN
jgi:hypothetical protein